ncbi:3-phosphoshikimate 1-carboxyvinyltransferase [Thermocrinis albus DSM 14484]|uniref:3-phosphoshikimate 1-carboxyvinyltransferase n=1 Tax=Thermocrinis albus (strain DSM 14484 / JCM 11386 / HI 11/12) TaxID=638303 RepID=D3SN12_THEAH|nr:3-phosphoshikimate 1-carboxyvinyltransferase [Thermocrinis albus]ADC90142.1 3-phosphoshikimate 1-carboxyvinyltransferase [Thermocrinis albus DSM 14484]
MLKVRKVKKVRGELRVPSDKSVSHRAVILSAMAEGESVVHDWLISADTLATLRAVRALGTKVQRKGATLRIWGRAMRFQEPSDVLNAQNSGTTARLLMGLLATQPFFSTITGDSSLRKRPMLRVVEPLRQMGAWLDGRERGNKLPVSVRGGTLKGISFFNVKASAQVKSAILLAGLGAEGYTQVEEPVLSRDHTERMLKLFGVEVLTLDTEKGRMVKIEGGQIPKSAEVFCPADPSSAAFFVALALLVDDSEVLLKDVMVNPTRDGFFRKVRQMGGEIYYENLREISGEPIADIRVVGGRKLKGVEVKGEEVPSLIDEIPVLSVLMALAEGRSRVKGASELRVKESDRIRAVVENLRSMGAKVEELEDGFEIEGVSSLKGAFIKTYGDHRIAMAFTVAGLVAEGETVIDNPHCVAVSYPDFYRDLAGITEMSF